MLLQELIDHGLLLSDLSHLLVIRLVQISLLLEQFILLLTEKVSLLLQMAFSFFQLGFLGLQLVLPLLEFELLLLEESLVFCTECLSLRLIGKVRQPTVSNQERFNPYMLDKLVYTGPLLLILLQHGLNDAP